MGERKIIRVKEKSLYGERGKLFAQGFGKLFNLNERGRFGAGRGWAQSASPADEKHRPWRTVNENGKRRFTVLAVPKIVGRGRRGSE